MCRLQLMARDAVKTTPARYQTYLQNVMLPEAQKIRSKKIPSTFNKRQATEVIERKQRYEKWQPLIDRGDAARRLSSKQMDQLVKFLTDYEKNPVTDLDLKNAEEVAYYDERRKWADNVVLVEANRTEAELIEHCQKLADARCDRGDLLGIYPDSWDSQEHTSGLFTQIYLPGISGDFYKKYLVAGTTRPKRWNLKYEDLPNQIRLNLQNTGFTEATASDLLGAWFDRETGDRE